MNPFVSIIIPAKNEEKYIGRCLNSVLNQNYPIDSFEVIVVDNNSSDQTRHIAESAGVFVYSKKTGLVGSVRNLGAKKAKGDILAFVDADCLLDENWLKKAVNLLKKEPDTVFGGGCLLRENATWIEKGWLLGDIKDRLPKDLIGASIITSRKSFQDVSGFNENISSGEDTSFSSSLREYGHRIRLTSELSVTHLDNAKTISAFLIRQVWHSENYLKDIRESSKDPTFYLVLINFFLFVFIIPAALILKFSLTLVFATSIFIATLFSVKRIFRAKIKSISIKNLSQIIFIDYIYLIGRTAGLAKGILNKLNIN